MPGWFGKPLIPCVVIRISGTGGLGVNGWSGDSSDWPVAGSAAKTGDLRARISQNLGRRFLGIVAGATQVCARLPWVRIDGFDPLESGGWPGFLVDFIRHFRTATCMSFCLEFSTGVRDGGENLLLTSLE
jgi:hypothetical protein